MYTTRSTIKLFHSHGSWFMMAEVEAEAAEPPAILMNIEYVLVHRSCKMLYGCTSKQLQSCMHVLPECGVYMVYCSTDVNACKKKIP
jgi:hypothetical protein